MGKDSKRRRAVYVNCDGLGANWVSPDATPHLSALRGYSLAASDHRAIFPSVTRPSAASVATGCWPQRHGLHGNRVALLEGERLVVRDVGLPDFRDHLRRATGATLRVPTLAQRVRASGGFVAFSNVSPGAAYFLDPDHHGFVYHRAGSFAPGGASIVGAGHLGVSHDLAGDVAMTERFCDEVVLQGSASVAVLWLANPDLTLHSTPLGSPEHLEALRIADECVGRVLASVAAARSGTDDILLLVGSDHGQETIGEGVSIEAWLRDHDCTEELVSGRMAVAAQGTSELLYALPDARAKLAGLLPSMSAEAWARSVVAGSDLEARCRVAGGHLVAAVDMGSDGGSNPFRVAGRRFVCTDGEKPARSGCGQHGGLGADETHPFLLLNHTSIMPGATSRTTSLVDIAPSILAFLGLPGDDLDGRSILDQVPSLPASEIGAQAAHPSDPT